MTSSTEHLPHLGILQQTCTELATAGGSRFTVGSVHQALNTLWKENEDDDELRALALAFGYMMDNSDGYRSALDDPEDGQPLSEGPFGPMCELKSPEGDGWSVFPPAPRRLPIVMLDVWARYAQEPTLHPLLRARLADLLWVRRHEQHHRWHETAVRAYVDLIHHQDVEVLEREKGAIRAVNLSRESRQPTLEQSAWNTLNSFVAMLLEGDGAHYGPLARCLNHLVMHDQPCDELVDRAISRHRSDPHRHMQLWQIKAQAATTKADRRRCITEAVNILVADANSSAGLRQLALLRDAWTLAQREELRELLPDLEAQIARVNVEDDFTTFESEITVTQDEIEEMLQSVIGEADNLLDTLLAFGRWMPIQTVEQNQQEALALFEAAPIQHLARRMDITNVDDQIAVTDIPSSQQPASMEIEVRRIERQQIEVSALLLGCNFLREINSRYEPTLETLVEHFRCVWISEDLARRIAKSYVHWQQNDQDSAVSVIILTIEAVIRCMAGTMGITVTHIKPGSDGQRVGEAVTLGRLLESIADHPAFGAAPRIPRYLDSALTNRWSLNLRNLLTHSLASLAEEQYAVLFHVVCLLRLLAENVRQADDPPQ